MNPIRKILIGGAVAGSALAGGALGASMFGTAGAATTTTTTPAAATAPAATAPAATAPAATTPGQTPQSRPAPNWSQGGHQANGKTETLLTGDDKAKAVAAAQAAVPGATAQRAETDADGATYEVHMTKSDGSIVTVKLDANFKVTQVADGMA